MRYISLIPSLGCLFSFAYNLSSIDAVQSRLCKLNSINYCDERKQDVEANGVDFLGSQRSEMIELLREYGFLQAL